MSVLALVALLLSGVAADSFLSDWMGALEPVIANRTLLDLSLPGTHDTLTYDLSRTVADRANDIEPELAWILHTFDPAFPFVTTFVREQAKTQKLDIVGQLNSGVRFLDLRIILTAAPNVNGEDWYALHFLETHEPVITYLKQIREWLSAHPKEILVMWYSRHGSTSKGDSAFPDVPHSEMHRFWAQVQDIFKGLLLDTRVSKMNTTTYSELLERNHRVVAYFEDWGNFTQSSPLAYDAKLIDNQLGGLSIDHIEKSYNDSRNVFKTAHATLAGTKKANKFWLKSMATSSPSAQVKGAALIHFLFDKFAAKKCAESFNIPGMTSWCPATLLDVSQLRAYYNQFELETAVRGFDQGYGFPNAIYLDAVDINGTIHTGSNTDWSKKDNYYCYADTLILYNVLQSCKASPHPTCGSLQQKISQRRSANPFHVWDDASHGRHSTWPVKL